MTPIGARIAQGATPLVKILRTYGIRRDELAAWAGVDSKTVARLCRGKHRGMKLETLCRVAVTLGVAPAELVPGLATRPRHGGLIGRRRSESRDGKRGLPKGEPTRSVPRAAQEASREGGDSWN